MHPAAVRTLRRCIAKKEVKLKENTHITLSLTLDKPDFSLFSPLLQQGFRITAQVGRSMKHLLCEQLKVEADYLAERINTIFLDSKPVDDVDTAIVNDGSTVALSASMPGLVGATFRRGGVLATFRSGISCQGKGENADVPEEGTVKIKLFNLLVGELGPVFLSVGIWAKKEDVEDVINAGADTLQSFIRSAEKDGHEISLDQLAVLNWDEAPENVFLKAVVNSGAV